MRRLLVRPLLGARTSKPLGLEVIGAILCTLLVSGCSVKTPEVAKTPSREIENSTPSDFNSVSVPSQWTEVRSNDNKLTLRLPPQWLVSKPGNREFVQTMASLQKKYPGHPSFDDPRYYFMAFSSEPVNHWSDNLNVLRNKTQHPILPTEKNARALQAELPKRLPVVGQLTAKLVRLPIGDVFRYQATLELKSNDNSKFQTFVVSYMWFTKQEQYTVTFSGSPDQQANFAEFADQVMSSLRIDQRE